MFCLLNNSTNNLVINSKNNIYWKPVPSFWKYLIKYRHHFHTPIFFSLLAILVNLPAFFEMNAIQCFFFAENRFGYIVSFCKLNAINLIN